MRLCPRCQQQISDPTRTNCPLCYTPLSTAAAPPAVPTVPALPGNAGVTGAQPVRPVSPAAVPPLPSLPMQPAPPAPVAPVGYYSPPAGQAPPPAPPARPGRVSLTGEFVEAGGYAAPSAPTLSASPPRPGYGPPPSQGLPDLPGYITQRPAPAASPSAYQPARAYRAPNGMNPYLTIRLAAGAVGLIIALFSYLARGASGGIPGFSLGGGSNPESASLRSPQSAAQSVMQAVHSKDWHKLYFVCAFETGERKSENEASEFQRELSRVASINNNPLAIINLMAAATEFHAQSGSLHGSRADVPTDWKIPYEGEVLTLHGTAHMVQQNGNWELDLTGPTGSGLDDMLGSLVSRTGHGPAIVIPHFGPFSPHNIPEPPHFTPPPQPAFTPPVPSGGGYSPGFSGGNPNNPNDGANPGYRGPRYTPTFPAQPSFPQPRFGPGSFPRGPRFSPYSPGAPGGYSSPGGSSGMGGPNNGGNPDGSSGSAAPNGSPPVPDSGGANSGGYHGGF